MGIIFGSVSVSDQKADIRSVRKMASGYWQQSRLMAYTDSKVAAVGYNMSRSYDESVEKCYSVSGDGNLILIGDIEIDNRTFLLDLLKIEDQNASNAEVVMELYLAKGEQGITLVAGSYAIVIVDTEQGSVKLIKDPLAHRSLYYMLHDGYLFFASNIDALKSVVGRQLSLNELWIVNYFCNPYHVTELDGRATVYEEISQVPPATIVTHTNGKTGERKIWRSIAGKKYHLTKDEDYEHEMKELFIKILEEQTGLSDGIAVSMSGGIDSATIAALINDYGTGRFYSYTSVPYNKFVDYTVNSNWKADEKKQIEALKQKFNKMNHSYVSSEDCNAYNSIDRLLDLTEQPYSIIENLFWVDNIARMASEDGCKVILKGSWGNNTFSFGDVFIHLNTLFHDFRFIEFVRTVKKISEFTGRPSRRYYKEFIRRRIPALILKGISRYEDDSIQVVVNESMRKRVAFDSFYKKKGYGKLPTANTNFYNYHQIYLEDRVVVNGGNIRSRIHQVYDIVEKDPTSDVRMFEFCHNIPYGQFLKDGKERSLARRAFKGIVPDEVIENYSTRGLQSADFLQRNMHDFDNICNEIGRLLENEAYCKYFDIDVIDYHKRMVTSKNLAVAKESMYQLIRLIVFGRFLIKNLYI